MKTNPKQKTPLMELIEKIDKGVEMCKSVNPLLEETRDAWISVKTEALKLLPKEREIIETAFYCGFPDGDEPLGYKLAKDYFNQTFEQ